MVQLQSPIEDVGELVDLPPMRLVAVCEPASRSMHQRRCPGACVGVGRAAQSWAYLEYYAANARSITRQIMRDGLPLSDEFDGV